MTDEESLTYLFNINRDNILTKSQKAGDYFQNTFNFNLTSIGKNPEKLKIIKIFKPGENQNGSRDNRSERIRILGQKLISRPQGCGSEHQRVKHEIEFLKI